jgi:hypothetical protein
VPLLLERTRTLPLDLHGVAPERPRICTRRSTASKALLPSRCRRVYT